MLLVVLLGAYLLGFVAAIPVGASQVAIIRNCLAGRAREAHAVIAGCATGDLSYGMISLFGLAPFVQLPWITTAARVGGSLVMMYLGIRTIAKPPRTTASEDSQAPPSRGVGAAYAAGLTFSAMNPLMIVWWLMGFKALTDYGLSTTDSRLLQGALVVGAVGGMASYQFLVSRISLRMKNRLLPRTMELTIKSCGAFLVLAGLVILARTLLSTTGL